MSQQTQRISLTGKGAEPTPWVPMDGVYNHRTLVLNRVWQAVNIIGIKRAISLLVQDHAQVIFAEEGQFHLFNAEDWFAFSLAHPPRPNQPCIHTIRMTLRIPKVVLLRYYDRLPVQEVKFCRQAVYERDDFRCQYCGKTFTPDDLNLDHVIPRHHGGKTNWENVVTSCVHCNTRKANRLPHEVGMRLIRKPERPKWRPFVSTLAEDELDADWQHFLGKTKTN